nr:MAG TPA: hypothetical protein [Caudoviricetes sp.]
MLVLIAFSNQPIIVPIIVVTTVIIMYLNIEYFSHDNRFSTDLVSLRPRRTGYGILHTDSEQRKRLLKRRRKRS